MAEFVAASPSDGPDGVASAGFLEWLDAASRTVAPSNPIPLYHQIADLLRGWIGSAARPGVQLPTEQQLCQRLNVSRATVQKALDLLAAEQLIARVQGRGTFVDPRPLERALVLRSLWDDLVEAGREINTIVLEQEVIEPPPDVRVHLASDHVDRVVRLLRVRQADGQPFALLRNWLPLPACAGVMDADLTQDSLYHVLEHKCGLALAEANEVLGARRPTPFELEHLELHDGEPVLAMTRQTFTVGGDVIEWADHAYPASRSQFRTRVTRASGVADGRAFTLQQRESGQ